MIYLLIIGLIIFIIIIYSQKSRATSEKKNLELDIERYKRGKLKKDELGEGWSWADKWYEDNYRILSGGLDPNLSKDEELKQLLQESVTSPKKYENSLKVRVIVKYQGEGYWRQISSGAFPSASFYLGRPVKYLGVDKHGQIWWQLEDGKTTISWDGTLDKI